MMRTTIFSLVLLLSLLPDGLIEKTGAWQSDLTRLLVRDGEPLQAPSTTPGQTQHERSEARNDPLKTIAVGEGGVGLLNPTSIVGAQPGKLIRVPATETTQEEQKQSESEASHLQPQEAGGGVIMPPLSEELKTWPPASGKFPVLSQLFGLQQPPSEVPEREPNDTQETAQVITLPVTINGFAAPRDCRGGCTWCFVANRDDRCDDNHDFIEDWYRFTITQLTTVRVTLFAPNPTGVDFNIALSLFRPGENFLPSSAGSFQSGTPPESFTITLEAGTYVIALSNNELSRTGTTPSTYKLQIEAFPISLDLGVTTFDPNPKLLDDDGATVTIKSNDDDLKDLDLKPIRRVKDVIADGVTKLLLRVETEARQVTFSLPSAADGTLSTLEDQNNRRTAITVPMRVINNTGPFAFAVYNAPLDFSNDPNDTRPTRNMIITISAEGRSVPYTITLHRPPVVLVHGLWSKPKTWSESEFDKYLSETYLIGLDQETRRKWIEPADYSHHAADSFDPANPASKPVERVGTAIRKVLRGMRHMRIAATQVDIIAHSMGAPVTRSYGNNQEYERRENFRKGDIHKFITIGGAHLGSPLATILWENRNRLTPFLNPPSAIGFPLFLRWKDIFAAFGHPIGDGIQELRPNSSALEHIGETVVPSHTIVGVKPLISPSEILLTDLLFFVTLNRTLTLGKVFGDEHDLIVPVTSQQAKLSEPLTSSFGNLVHSDYKFFDPLEREELESDDIKAEAVKLLRAPIDHNLFASSLDPPVSFEASMAVAPEVLSFPLRPQSQQEPGIGITSPEPGSTARPGDTIRVTAEGINGRSLQEVFFFIERVGTFIVDHPSFDISFTVPVDSIGPIDIIALAQDTEGGISGDSTFVVVQPTANLLSISVEPETLKFSFLAEEISLRVVGNFDDGVGRDLTASTTGTIYRTGSQGSIVDISADGMVHAVANGRDIIIVSNGDVSTSVPAEVQASNSAPRLLSLEEIAVAPGMVLEIPVIASDLGCDQLSVAAIELPAFATFIDNGDRTGTLRLSPMIGDVGEYPDGLITVLDDGTPRLGDSERINISVSAEAANIPVIATAEGALGDGVLVVTLSGRDANADVMKLSIRRFDSLGAEIAEQDFDIPSATGQQDFDLTIRATDGEQLADTAFVQLHLIDAAGNRSVGFNVEVEGAGDTVPPFVVLHEPNGEQTLLPGSTVAIHWDACDNMGIISQDILLSVDGGETYLPIVTGLSGSRRSFNWRVPSSLATDQGRIRIVAWDQADKMAQDESDADFRVPDTVRPAIRLITPNGGEAFRPGRLTIRWTSSDNVEVVSQDIFVSTDGGRSFRTMLASGLSGDVQSFDWDLPANLTTTQARLRIVVRDVAENFNQDESDGVFVIDSIPPSVAVSSPNGSEFIKAGRFTIRWAASDNVGVSSQDILLSVDGGASFKTQIASNLSRNSRSFSWNVPSELVTTQARVRVVVRDLAGNKRHDDSNANFTIDPLAPTVTVTAPNGGEMIMAGHPFTVRWTSSDNIRLASHTVQLSTNGGRSFTNLDQGLPATTQSFDWSVPVSLATSQARIRVIAIDAARNTGLDTSDTDFTVPDSAPPNVTIRSPNGGELVKAGRLTIRWSSSDNVRVASHDVLLSTDGGASFPLTLAPGLPGNQKSFNWDISPSVASTRARIKVIALDAADNVGQDDSDADFTIDPVPPSVRVISPNGGESIAAGATTTIRWDSSDNLELARHSVFFSSDGGRSFTPIVQGLGTDARSFDWSIPTRLATTEGRIRIIALDITGNTTRDESDADFTITGVSDIDLLRTSLDFGSVPLGNDKDLTLTIQNLGGVALTISSIVSESGSAEFSYISPNLPFTISASSSTNVTLRFTPISLGTKSDTFIIISDDPDEGILSLTVSGTGVNLIGQQIFGSLSSDDDRSVARGEMYSADRYTFTGTDGQLIAISMTSTTFDTFLYLLKEDHTVVTSDDDGGDGTNSRIPAGSGFFRLPSTGTYIIETTSFSPNITGTYTLVVTDPNNSIEVFSDDMESGIGGWSAEGSWAQTTTSSHSPTHSWTDSPFGNYSNNQNVSLISPPINLTGLKSVRLRFWHRHALEQNFDFGQVWVTTDNGRTFTRIASFTGSLSSWRLVTLDLGTFAGRTIRVYFQLVSDGGVAGDGWYIDDVFITGRN